MGKNKKKQYEKQPTSPSLFKERKYGSHDNWAPPLDFKGGREPESLFEALVILAKPPLLSAALAGDLVWAAATMWMEEEGLGRE